MTRTRTWVLAGGTIVLAMLTGCDWPTSPPRTADWKVPERLAVVSGNQEELAAVTAVDKARVNYEYRLVVLQDYYRKTGNMDKLRWAERERANLRQAQTFTWEGAPEISPPAGESLERADEHILVEYTVAARKEYLAAVRALLDYYKRTDPGSYKYGRVANVMRRFDPVRTYMYFLDAEIPQGDLRPVEVIPAADALFAQAHKLYIQGQGLLRTFVTTDYDKERQALDLFLELAHKYPNSTKIAQAAFYIGEIYKEYFNEDIRAVNWYQKAWQWDPTLALPARFQAATVHDQRLQNRAKALELYRQVIQYEQFNASNVRYSHQRIRELTGT